MGETTNTKMDRRVDELIKQNVLLQNDLSRVNADMVQVKLQADEQVKEVNERLRVHQHQYEAIVTGSSVEQNHLPTKTPVICCGCGLYAHVRTLFMQ